MDKTLFRLSDNEKALSLETLLNPNFTEEGGWKQDRIVLDVYDDYAICYNMTEQQYERAYYTKENDNVVLGDITKVFIVDVTADEQMALEAIKTVSGTYEVAKTSIEENEALKASLAEKETELEEKISTLEATATELENKKNEAETTFSTKIEALEAEKVELAQKVSDITSENESLTEFKKKIELEQKEAILGKYEEHLSEETYGQLKADIDKYSVIDFKKEVCTAAIESPTIFSKETEPQLFYSLGDVKDDKGVAPVSGVERILSKYKKNGGK